MALSLKKQGENTPFAKKAFCLVVMFIALVVVLMSSRPLLSKALVEAKLHSFNDILSAHFHDAGANAEFTWQDVKVHGMGSKAVIFRPLLTISDLAAGAPKTAITTDKLIFLPVRDKDVDYKVLLPDPVTITDAAGRATQIRADGGVPTYSFGTRKEGEVVAYAHQLHLPSKLVFSSGAPSQDASQPPLGGSSVSFAPDPVVSVTTYTDGRNAASLSFRNVVIAESSGPFSLTIGSVNASAHDDVAKDGRVPFESTMALADISAKSSETQQQGPYTVKLNVAGTKAAMLQDGTQPSDVEMELREFSVSSEKFTINASGTINRKPDEAFPFGKVDVKIDHFDALRDNAAIPAWIKSAMVDAFNRITGTDTAKAQDVQFSIARDKGGKSSIGNSTPEEIGGLVLSHAVAGGQPAPAPVTLGAPAAPANGAVAPAPAAPDAKAPTTAPQEAAPASAPATETPAAPAATAPAPAGQ